MACCALCTLEVTDGGAPDTTSAPDAQRGDWHSRSVLMSECNLFRRDLNPALTPGYHTEESRLGSLMSWELAQDCETRGRAGLWHPTQAQWLWMARLSFPAR